MTRASPVDWEAVEVDYRAGVLSLAEIGKRHGVTKGRISQVAKAKSWERDLAAKIRARAEAKLNEATVNAALNGARQKASEAQVVEASAQAMVDVKLAHRKDIRRGRDLANRLLAELEQVTDHPELGPALVDALCDDPDESPDVLKLRRRRLNDLLDRVVALPARVGTLKTLSDALRNLIGLEREAWGMATDGKGGAGAGDGGEAPRLSELDRAARVAAIIDRARKAQAAAQAAQPT